jgi:hypothetical protein
LGGSLVGLGPQPNRPDLLFAQILDTDTIQAAIRAGNVGDASACILPVGALLEFAIPLMKEAASDAGPASNAEH